MDTGRFALRTMDTVTALGTPVTDPIDSDIGEDVVRKDVFLRCNVLGRVLRGNLLEVFETSLG